MNWEGLFFAFLVGGLAALWLARRSHAATGLPAGRLVYVDTARWRPLEQPLFSRHYLLCGRPDYLVQSRRDTIPVEVKSRPAPSSGPYTAHILQLAAYCLLVKEAFGHCPPHGIILYAGDAGTAYEIDYTPALERELLATLEAMRGALTEGNAPRDHDQVARCQACGFRTACKQSLT